MINIYLHDDQYGFHGIGEYRKIARGVIITEEGKIALHIIKRQDFGMKAPQIYYETPGGGVDEGESYEEALIRECQEEIGYRAEVITEIGIVHDFYNVIERENENHYYLARAKEKTDTSFVSSGDMLIQKTIYIGIDEAISLMESQEDILISGLVKRRELPILREAKRILRKMGSFIH